MNIITVRTFLFNILLVVVLYIFIYNPGLTYLPFGAIKLLYPLLVVLLLGDSYKVNKDFFQISLYFIILFSYVFIHESLFGNYLFSFQTLINFIEIWLLPYCLVFCFFAILKNDKIYTCILYVSVIAALISIAMILNSGFNDFVKNQLLKQNEYFDVIKNRTFGVSEYLTFIYAVLQGMLAIWCLNGKFRNRFILFFPFILLSGVFNARIAFISFFVGLIYCLYTNRIPRKTLGFFFMGIAFVVFLIYYFFYEDYSHLIKFSVFGFFEQIFSSDGSGNSLNTLLDEMVFFPTKLSTYIWGDNIDVYANQYGFSSDIGYIIQLFYGGILYIILLLIFPLYLWYKNSKYLKNDFISLAIIILLIVNFKGVAFNSNPLFRLITLLYIYEFYYSSQNINLHLRRFT